MFWAFGAAWKPSLTAALPHYPEGSPELADALTNLHNVRWALARRDFSP